ncbi:flavin reductase family protein [Amorphus sp. 3PC139-8]|uniref:flavin reductase family protein n=1 Tax=Amorphus sp. 3PC139-8 TaxID=2735676 RepID=UPI00345DA4A4
MSHNDIPRDDHRLTAAPVPAASSVTASTYRSAMAQVAAPVHIITTLCGDGRYGMTATAVCSVTDTPPRLLVCINRSSQSYERFLESRILAVNTVAANQQELAATFAGAGGVKDMTERFGQGRWDALETGAPILADAIASFDCRLVDSTRQSSHDVLFCEVIALKTTANVPPLLYFDRRFTSLTS